jgi:hypothetical protein
LDWLNKKAVRITILILIAAGASVGIWEGGFKYQVFPKKFATVVEGKIYRSGNIADHLLAGVLRKYKIKTIINLAGPGKYEEETARRLGVKILYFPLSGSGIGDVNNYVQAVAVMNSACMENRPVLVHCDAGAQRTGGVVAVYRLLVEKGNPQEIIKEMESFMWDDESCKSMVSFLNSNMKTMASKLAAIGVIKEMPEPVPQLNKKHRRKQILKPKSPLDTGKN